MGQVWNFGRNKDIWEINWKLKKRSGKNENLEKVEKFGKNLEIWKKIWRLLFLVYQYKEVYPVIEGLAGAKWECRLGILYQDVRRCNFWPTTPNRPIWQPLPFMRSLLKIYSKFILKWFIIGKVIFLLIYCWSSSALLNITNPLGPL